MCICISGHYFSLESVPDGDLHTCEPWTRGRRRCKYASGQSTEKIQECKNAGTGTALERVSQVRTDVDRLTYKNKCTRQPSIAAE